MSRPLTPPEYLEAVQKTILPILEKFTQMQRKVFIDICRDNFCLACGSDKLPCYCERDE